MRQELAYRCLGIDAAPSRRLCSSARTSCLTVEPNVALLCVHIVYVSISRKVLIAD